MPHVRILSFCCLWYNQKRMLKTTARDMNMEQAEFDAIASRSARDIKTMPDCAFVSVSAAVIADNKQWPDATPNPPIRLDCGTRVEYGQNVDILDGNGEVVARVVYRPNDPLNGNTSVYLQAFHGAKVSE